MEKKGGDTIRPISLAAARVDAGMTQKQAADAIGVSKTTIVNWESGKAEPKLKHVKRILLVYNRGIDEIFLPEKLNKI